MQQTKPVRSSRGADIWSTFGVICAIVGLVLIVLTAMHRLDARDTGVIFTLCGVIFALASRRSADD